MIISHKHRFIFLKTNKTAGTSIEIALSRHCGPDDVITPISLEDEELRSELDYPGPQNYLAPIQEYRIRDLARLVILRKKKRQYFNHITAREVRSHIGEQVWGSYFKFCFERNPWDRVISLYFNVHRTSPRPSISAFIKSGVPSILKSRGFDLYTIDGQIAVDKVCRFENLDEELEAITGQLGLSEKLDLPSAKSTFRNDNRSYREFFGDREKDIIKSLFSEEIDLFGYEF